ncbi:hypothetical protein MKW94_024235, partial [Papaver nudicaule]|nr:hypothetical protein [Papaver nudicaule]
VLKGYIRNTNRIEGSIVEGYIVEETVEFCSECLDIETIGIPADKSAEKIKDSEGTSLISDGGKPLSTPKQVKVSDTLRKQAHQTVLNNTMDVQPYIALHKSHLKKEFSQKSEAWLLKEHNQTFMDWLESKVDEDINIPGNDISQELEWIASGPSHQVFKTEGYEVSGYRFHTKDRDEKRVNQNSGISLVDEDNSCYYGVIEEIWLLDYHMIRIPVFKCAWVNQHGISKDDLDFTRADLGRIGHKTDPFILASHDTT